MTGSSCSAASCFDLLSKLQITNAHDAISTDLFNGRVVRAEQIRINNNTHTLWKVKIYNDQTGRTREAYFKPRQYGDEDGWGRAPMELVAYALNKKLGMDYVPPTAYRRWLDINGTRFAEGALIYAVPNSRILFDTDANAWNASPDVVKSDHRILSVLLQNQDGHYKNLLLGNHWVNGVDHPVFIDAGASLRRGTNVSMENYPAFRNSDVVERVQRKTFEKLKALNWNDLKEMGEFISEDEMRGILSRRDGIIRYFEKLMAQRGYDAVLIDP